MSHWNTNMTTHDAASQKTVRPRWASDLSIRPTTFAVQLAAQVTSSQLVIRWHESISIYATKTPDRHRYRGPFEEESTKKNRLTLHVGLQCSKKRKIHDPTTVRGTVFTHHDAPATFIFQCRAESNEPAIETPAESWCNGDTDSRSKINHAGDL